MLLLLLLLVNGSKLLVLLLLLEGGDMLTRHFPVLRWKSETRSTWIQSG
jgi:hypothetical protein